MSDQLGVRRLGFDKHVYCRPQRLSKGFDTKKIKKDKKERTSKQRDSKKKDNRWAQNINMQHLISSE